MSMEFNFTEKNAITKQIADKPNTIIEYFNSKGSKLSYDECEILSKALQEVKDTIRDLTDAEDELLDLCILKIKMLDDKDNFWNDLFHEYVDRCASVGMDITDPKELNDIAATFARMSKFIVPSAN